MQARGGTLCNSGQREPGDVVIECRARPATGVVALLGNPATAPGDGTTTMTMWLPSLPTPVERLL